MTANTVNQIDAVLESFTGASLSSLVGRRYLRNGNGGAPTQEPPPDVDG